MLKLGVWRSKAAGIFLKLFLNYGPTFFCCFSFFSGVFSKIIDNYERT